MTTGPAGLAPEDFWTDPYRTLDALVDRMIDQDFMGIVLDGPPVVDLGFRDTLPLVGARRCTLADDAATDFQGAAAITAVRLESNEVLAASAFAWKEPAEPEGPRGPASPGNTASPFALELRARLPELPWRPGTLLVTLLHQGESSTRVRAALTARGPAAPDARPRPAVWPLAGARALPRYQPAADATLPTGDPGIALAVDRVVLNTPEAWCVARGHFLLPLDPRDLIDPSDPKARARAGDPDATAVVAVTLVVVGWPMTGPWVYRLGVPVYDAAAPGRDARGFFAVDLFALPGFPRVAQTYHVWALSGEALSDAAPVALVAEDLLAPP